MSDDAIIVRPASRGDLEALVTLRLENGRVHAALDPSRYRMPDAARVRDAFDRALGDQPEKAHLLVADLGARVVGMAEVVPGTPPPPDQILIPIRTAQVHIIVAPDSRGLGVGTRLRVAAERVARQHGIEQLIAPIQTANARAFAFYGGAGYHENGRITIKTL